uniref:Uncharacterized protein n=1 Tax=Gopherus evgoodei TaxID=1825980 RepID=A0A8C4VJS5_9SAUR
LTKPSLIISTNEAVITMKTESSFKSTKISFKLGEVLEETLAEDKKTEVRPNAFLQSQSTNMGGGGRSFPTLSTTPFHVIGLQTCAEWPPSEPNSEGALHSHWWVEANQPHPCQKCRMGQEAKREGPTAQLEMSQGRR